MSDTQPITVDETVSAICSLGMQPLLMTGTLLHLIRQHFSDQQNIYDPILRRVPVDQPGTYIWRPEEYQNPNTHGRPSLPSGTIIEDAVRWDPNLTSGRPGIFVRRNGWQPFRIGINDEHLGRPDAVGHRVFSKLMSGSHTIFCIGSTGGETEKLAWEVAADLFELGPVIAEQMHLHRFAVAEIAGIGKIEEAGSNFTVPITVSYAFEHTWKLRQHAPWLKRIIFERLDANQT